MSSASALHALQQASHATFGQLSGQLSGQPLPLSFGDLPAEVAAIERGCGLLDWTGRGVIGVRGAEAAVFLNGITTNNVIALPKGRAQESLLCGTKGKILHAVTVVRTGETEFLIVTEPGETQAVASHLEAYHIREDLQLGVAGLMRVDALGPASGPALRSVGIDPAALVNGFAGQPVLAVNLPLGALPRLLLLLPPAAAPGLAQALLGANAAGGGGAAAAGFAGVRLVGLEAWEECRIWAGVPRFGVDYGPEFLPAEAALYGHIAFDKGCYVGQEVHARLHHRGHVNRKLMAVEMPEATAAQLAPGSELRDAPPPAPAAGRLTSLARLSRAGRRRGIALVTHAIAQARTALAAAGGPADIGGVADIIVSPLATDLGVVRR